MTDDELGREIARINAESIGYEEVARRVRELVSPALLAAIRKLAAEVRVRRDGQGMQRVKATIATDADPICREALDRARAKP